MVAPSTLLTFPEIVLQHIGHGSQTEVFSQLGWRKTPEASSFEEELETRKEHSFNWVEGQ